MKTLRFDAAQVYQTMDNFGASAAWFMDPVGENYPEAVKEQLAELLFSRDKGIGLSCFRMNLGGGTLWSDQKEIVNWERRSACFKLGPDGPYDWEQHAGQQWFMRRAKALGVEKTLAFVNTPPYWLTYNGHGRSDADSEYTTNLKPGNEAAFAQFLVDVLKHFEEVGMPFDYISPINEPENDWNTDNQEGCRYSNEDVVRTTLAVRKALDEAGLDTGLLIMENARTYELADLDQLPPELMERIEKYNMKFGTCYAEHMREVFNRPEIREAVLPIVMSHSYTSEYRENLESWRAPAKAALERYPGYTYWMSEFCLDTEHRDTSIEQGLRLARTVHFDVTRLNAAAWQWWIMLSACDWTDGLIYIDWPEDGNFEDVGFIPTKMLWALGHFSRFLRPGSRRVALEGADDPDGLMATGWLDAEGKPVAVLVNFSDEAAPVTLEGLPQQRWQPYLTTDDAGVDLKPLEAIDEPVLTVPPRAIITLVGTLTHQ